MFDFLSVEYFGNTLFQYLLFLVTVGAFFVAGKIVLYAAKGIGRRITAKSKTKLDDLFLDLIEEPIVFGLVIVGLFVGLQFLSFTDEIAPIAGNIIGVLVILLLAWVASRVVSVIIKEYIKPLASKTDSRLDDNLLPIISKISKAIIWILAAVSILGSFGYDLTAIIAGLGIGGLAFAFAAKETISDMFGGFSIFTSRPFVVGDFVDIGGKVSGTVEEVGLRHTRVRNLEKRVVIIPNSQVANSVITNISSAPAKKITMHLGLTYNTSVKNMQKAIKIVKEIINKNPNCEKNPLVFFEEFADSSVNLLVIYYIKPGGKSWLEVRSEVGLAIKETFDKNKLEFAFPSQTIYLQK